MRDDTGVYWTLQQFWAGLTAQPWRALQQENDQGVLWPFTGYRHEVEAICQKRSITPEELPTTTKAEFLSPRARESCRKARIARPESTADDR